MAHNQRFNRNDPINVANDEKYDPEATEELRAIAARCRFNLNSIDQMKKKIREGADPRVLLETNLMREYPGTSPFDAIAEMGQADFLQELFAMGLEPTAKILRAALFRVIDPQMRLNTATAILDENPDLIYANIVEGSGKTTTFLHLAIKNNLPISLIEVLLKYGANPDIQDEYGQTPLMIVAYYDIHQQRELTKLLLRYGAETQLENKRGFTARNYNAYKLSLNLLPRHNGGRRKTRRMNRKKSKKTKSRRRH